MQPCSGQNEVGLTVTHDAHSPECLAKKKQKKSPPFSPARGF